MNSNPIQNCKTGLLGKGAKEVDGSCLDAPIVAFYFSAHWCPPCRNFTPVLAEWYNEVNSTEKQVEIVFLTCDRDDQSFKEYFDTMPWVALPHGDSRIQGLKTDMGCSGIPYLVVYKNDGTLVTKSGRGDVTGNPAGCVNAWLGK